MTRHERFAQYGEQIAEALSDMADSCNPTDACRAIKRLDAVMAKVTKYRNAQATFVGGVLDWAASNRAKGIA